MSKRGKGWPEEGDKIRIFQRVPAFGGKVFVCTGRRYKKGKKCIAARNLYGKQADFTIDLNRFFIEEA